jgi:hypothetical protein
MPNHVNLRDLRPRDDEGFFRMKVAGDGETVWFNVTPEAMATIVAILGMNEPRITRSDLLSKLAEARRPYADKIMELERELREAHERIAAAQIAEGEGDRGVEVLREIIAVPRVDEDGGAYEMKRIAREALAAVERREKGATDG